MRPEFAGQDGHAAVGRAGLGVLGIWLARSLGAEEIIARSLAAERLGYGAVWVSGGQETGVFDLVGSVLNATKKIVVGTSILNMYAETPRQATDIFNVFEAEHPGRLIVGIGPSHAPLIEARLPGSYLPPLTKSREYLEALDRASNPIPRDRRVLSALGPLALKLAVASSLGTIPYLTPVAHTRAARKILGPDALLAPELTVVLGPDLDSGRTRARSFLKPYLEFSNYTSNLLKHGYSQADLDYHGSDLLLDGLFAFDTSSVASRIHEHLSAGADHVALQILPLDGQSPTRLMAAVAAALQLGEEGDSERATSRIDT